MKINFTTPVCATTSYGICGLNILKALSQLGHEVALFPLGQVEAKEGDHALIRESIERGHFFYRDTPSLRLWHQWALSQHVGKGVHAAFPIFELDTLTEQERHHLNAQDVVFVASQWAQDVLLRNYVQTKVVVSPLGVDHVLANTETPLPNSATTFLHVGKWEVRKNQQAVVEAFNEAFEQEDNVRLIIHCHNPFLSPQETTSWVDIANRSRLHTKIFVTKDRLPQGGVVALMRGADCGVFPSRAEGYNLGLAEMMALGKEVIATNYSAHTEFCNEENASLITIDSLEPAFDGRWFTGLGQWAKWGESQQEQLIEHMRAVHRKKQSGESLVNGAGAETMKRFTWENTARIIAEALDG